MLIHRQIGGGRSIRIYAPGLISGNFFHFQKVQKVLFFGYKPMGFNAREYGKHYDGRTIHGRASATNISGIFRCPLLRPQLRPVRILPVTNVAIPGQCPRTTRLPAPMHTAFARRIVGGAKHLGRSQGLRKNRLRCRQIGHQFDVASEYGKHYQNQHTLHSHQTLSHIRNDNLRGQRLA